MASSGFSIDIGKLPPTEGLGPLAQSSPDTLAQGASQRSPTNPANTNTLSEPISPTHSQQPHALSSVFGTTTNRASSPFSASPTTSPGRQLSQSIRSRAPSTAAPSPRALSPATSQIFERDVQEPNALSLAPDLGTSVPGHVLQHDDYIPTVLDQSADVIADPSFSPDEIEIVMHRDHVPAVAVAEAAVAGGAGSGGGAGGGGGGGGGMVDSGFLGSPPPEADSPPPPNIVSSLHPSDQSQSYAQSQSQSQSQSQQQQQPSYGNVANSPDPRRLSFISFADVVHASQSDHSAYSSLPRSASPANLHPHPPQTQHSPPSKQFASPSSLGFGFNTYNGLDTPVRRSSASLGAGSSGAPSGRRGSVGLSVSGLRERAEMGESSPHVEAGLPHGEERGELVVESLRSAMGRERE